MFYERLCLNDYFAAYDIVKYFTYFCLKIGQSISANYLVALSFFLWNCTIIMLRGINTLSGEAALVKVFCLLSEKVSTVKGIFSLRGCKFFPFRLDSFQKGFAMQESKHEITKVVSLLRK